ncbi:hypothetical protein [Cereibacter sphaeroides]|uniref:hypothetical protein n=1 Tax=Cereibacter sphaeroides TaxID=1063 RepID=UPI001F3676F9|nr:hypothetical protein [Cereibacter sphaeroides]MCE6967450.1 hypothetical protein [Cereibacter sphaeroides]
MYLLKDARHDEEPDQAPSVTDIDLEAVRRFLDRQAEEDRRVPAAFWIVTAASLVIFSLLLLALF